MIELKTCPFCGWEDTAKFDKYKNSGVYWHFVYCDECGAQGPVCGDKETAAIAWNERAT